MKTRILAIDRELEHYIRVIIMDKNYTDLSPGYIQLADKIADKLINRYRLDYAELFTGEYANYDEINNQLESILQAQLKAKVFYTLETAK